MIWMHEGDLKSPVEGVHDSFRADNGPATKGANAVPVDGKKIRLPIIGWVRVQLFLG